MKTITIILVYCLYGFIIIGCSILPKIDEDKLPSSSRVGIVTLIYGHMSFVKISGIPIYSYTDKTHFIYDWNMDKHVQSSVEKKLKRRFNIIDISYNTAKLKKGFNTKNLYTGLPIFYISSQEIKNEFKRIVKAHDLDAIIIVSQNYTKPSPIYKPYAYGLAYKKLFREKLVSFASISFRIYDAKSLQILALSENIESYVDVDGIPVYTSFDEYSNDEREILKSWVIKAFDSAISEAIYKSGFN